MTRDPAREPKVVAERQLGDETVLLLDDDRAVSYRHAAISRRTVLKAAAAGSAAAGVTFLALPMAEAAASGSGNKILDLLTEFAAYAAGHATNGGGNSSGQFSYYAGADGDAGGSIVFTAATLQTTADAYTASTITNGKFGASSTTVGPFTAGQGVQVVPDGPNSGGQHGHPAVIKLTIPAAPSGSTYSGAGTLAVTATRTAGTGSAWVYVTDASGTKLSPTPNPVQVAGTAMNRSFAIPQGVTGQVYYVAIAGNTNAAVTLSVNVTATLPYV